MGLSRPQRDVRSAPIHQWILPDGRAWTEFYREDESYLLRFPGLADFEVSTDGGAIRSWPVPGVAEDSLRHLYLNQVLPLALSRRGHLVFHASAVELGGEAVAFVGCSGSGKSTLAASFATAGHPFLVDDGLVLDARAERVLPNHPSIRLWEDSQLALIGTDAATSLAVPFTSKMRFVAGGQLPFCGEARPLAKAFFLAGHADEIAITAMGAAEALIEWVRHSFVLDVREQEMLATHFDALSALANRPIAFRLRYPHRYAELPRLRERILEFVRQAP